MAKDYGHSLFRYNASPVALYFYWSSKAPQRISNMEKGVQKIDSSFPSSIFKRQLSRNELHVQNDEMSSVQYPQWLDVNVCHVFQKFFVRI